MERHRKPMSCERPVLQLLRGSTERHYFCIGETGNYVYKTITAVSLAAPCILTVPGHGVPDAWDIEVVGCRGVTRINGTYSPLVIDANTLKLSDVNALGFPAYLGNGVVKYEKPMAMSPASDSAVMNFYDSDGQMLLTLASGTSALTLNTDQSRVELMLSGAQWPLLKTECGFVELVLNLNDDIVLPFKGRLPFTIG